MGTGGVGWYYVNSRQVMLGFRVLMVYSDADWHVPVAVLVWVLDSFVTLYGLVPVGTGRVPTVYRVIRASSLCKPALVCDGRCGSVQCDLPCYAAWFQRVHATTLVQFNCSAAVHARVPTLPVAVCEMVPVGTGCVIAGYCVICRGVRSNTGG